MNIEQSSQKLVEQGLAALEMAEFDDAIEIFGRAAVEDATNARAWFYLGLCYLETRQVDLAVEALNRSIRAEPDYADAHYLLGTAVGALGRLDAARDCYQRALERDPQHSKAEEFLIRTEALLASREHYRNAVRIITANDREPDWFNRAVRELLHSVAIFDQSPARHDLSKLASDVTRSGDQKIVYDFAESEGPFWLAAIKRAEAAFARKNWPEAATAYHEALDLSPDHAFIHHALGLIYFALGDVEGATRAWQRALDLEPDYDFSSYGRLSK